MGKKTHSEFVPQAKTRKIKLSISLKLLGILIFLVLFSLGTYLFFALDMFSKDKSAYIYETGLSTVDSLSEQVTSFINFNVKTGIGLAIMAKSNPGQVQKFVNLDQGLVMFVVAQQKYGNIEQIARLINTNLVEQNQLDKVFLKNMDLKDLMKTDRFDKKEVLLINTTHTIGIPSVAVLFFNQKEKEFYISVLSLDKIIEQFTQDKIYKNYLLDNRGIFYIHPDKAKKKDIGLRIEDKEVLKILKGQVNSGTKELKNKKGEIRLVTYKKIDKFNMAVFSEINKDKAFMAAKFLINKSIYFGIFLIGVAIFIGILMSRSITIPISKLFDGTQKMARGDFESKVELKAHDEFGVLSDSFNYMGTEIVRLLKETEQKARMAQELETAKTVQETLFPPLKHQGHEIEISGYYEPASECGGDWWYYSDVGDRVFLWIGDATGHGVPAALVTSAACSAAYIIENIPSIQPKRAMELLNQAIYHTSKGKMNMTFFLACYEKESMKLTYSNASQNPPFKFNRANEKLSIRKLEPLDEVNGPRLGQAPDSTFDEATITMSQDDMIFFYTDGVTEMENPSGEQWGERKFLKALVNSVEKEANCDYTIEKMHSQILDYKQEADLMDDITFFMCRVV